MDIREGKRISLPRSVQLSDKHVTCEDDKTWGNYCTHSQEIILHIITCKTSSSFLIWQNIFSFFHLYFRFLSNCGHSRVHFAVSLVSLKTSHTDIFDVRDCLMKCILHSVKWCLGNYEFFGNKTSLWHHLFVWLFMLWARNIARWSLEISSYERVRNNSWRSEWTWCGPGLSSSKLNVNEGKWMSGWSESWLNWKVKTLW